MLNTPFSKVVASYLILALIVLSLPARGWAMFVPSGQASTRSQDLSKIQATLESTVIKQRLMDYGLTAEETAARLDRLSDEQVHQLASNLDAVQAGGDGVGAVIFLLVVVIVVIVVLEVTGHHIVIR